MSVAQREEGFTIVEVVIALFVIGLLLGAGYQAYGLVVNGSRETRLRAEASNIAYEALRRTAATVPTPCTASGATSLTIPSSSTLPTPRTMTRTITCPNSANSAVSRVTVTLTYGPSAEKVVHALYAR